MESGSEGGAPKGDSGANTPPCAAFIRIYPGDRSRRGNAHVLALPLAGAGLVQPSRCSLRPAVELAATGVMLRGNGDGPVRYFLCRIPTPALLVVQDRKPESTEGHRRTA